MFLRGKKKTFDAFKYSFHQKAHSETVYKMQINLKRRENGRAA